MQGQFIRFFLACFFSLLAFCSYGQEQGMSLDRVRLKNNNLEAIVNVNTSKSEFNIDNLSVQEYQGGNTAKALKIVDVLPLEKDNVEDTLTIIFLIDNSGSMKKFNRIEKARQAVISTVKQTDFPKNTSLYLATFEDFISENFEISSGNVNQVVREKVVIGGDTDLYQAVIEKTEGLAKESNGKMALIVLSDGKDENDKVERYDLEGTTRPTAQDVYRVVEADTLENLMIFPVALPGADTTFLKQVTNKTVNTIDRYIPISDEEGVDLSGIFGSILNQVKADFKVIVEPDREKYWGEDRQFELVWNNKGEEVRAQKHYQEGTSVRHVDPLKKDNSTIDWLLLFIVGFGFVLALLSILGLAWPKYRSYLFKKNYVEPFSEKKYGKVFDEYIGEAIQEGELVVHKCGKPITVSSWNENGQCPNYPECTRSNLFRCNGDGQGEDAYANGSFWEQQGSFKIFNWIWFGAAGGFGAWFLNALYEVFSPAWMESFHANLLSLLGDGFIETYKLTGEYAAEATMTGIALSIGIGTALGIADENGTQQSINWKRLLLRVLAFSCSAFIIFLAVVTLQYVYKFNPFFGILGWTLLGLTFGWILSFWSNIVWWRGMLAGGVAFAVGFLFYYLMIYVLPIGSEYIRLFAFILTGALVGLITVSILTRLEEIGLEVIAPSSKTFVNYSVSKWLKGNEKVTAGTSPKAKIYFKWETDKHIFDHHFQLIYNRTNEKVKIIPVYKNKGDKFYELLVNNRIVEEEGVLLNHDDTISFGAACETKLQYKERRQVKELELKSAMQGSS